MRLAKLLVIATLLISASVDIGSAQIAAPTASPSKPAAATSGKAAPGPAAPSAALQPAGAMLDINSASKSELDALPGIGGVRADAIIKGRPYKGKDELFQKKIIPQSVYDGIKDRIIAKQKS